MIQKEKRKRLEEEDTKAGRTIRGSGIRVSARHVEAACIGGSGAIDRRNERSCGAAIRSIAYLSSYLCFFLFSAFFFSFPAGR
jgi:hypothetical protein